jgi:hypothetical protein
MRFLPRARRAAAIRAPRPPMMFRPAFGATSASGRRCGGSTHRRALVAGAGSGIEAATAQALDEPGAEVQAVGAD